MRALKSADPDSALLLTLKFIYTAGKTRTKSDYARAYATEIDPGSWVKIGCAWEHEDGQGLSLKLDLLPINYQRLVIRHRNVGTMPAP
jgi:hypothetical protein